MRTGMVAANLTGGEAEELRKAMGGKRSDAVLAGLKTRLIDGMTANGFDAAQQAEVMRILSTVREFMFPESHAHSFASVAYSSAYTKFHYLAAYLCALLNNQPMGFYSPSTLINDAKRHGLKVRPIDVQESDWNCTLEKLDEEMRSRYRDPFAVRIGLRYVKGLRQETGDAIASTRQSAGPFTSEYDLKRRVPSIRKNELTLLASVGAFNWTGETHDRRTALWRAERAGQDVGPLFANSPDEFEIDLSAPLVCMKVNERLEADFFIAGFTLGPHPMAYQRTKLDSSGIMRAADLKGIPDGTFVRIAGAVIARQRPGTASGFIFLSNEDETGISNAIIHPKLYENNRVTVTKRKFLLIEGVLQNQDGVISVKASAVRPLDLGGVAAPSRNFH